MGWSREIRFSEVSFSEVCISVIISKALGWIKWHFCEGYEAGKIRDDLLHRGTVKPRGGGWRKSGEWTQGKNRTLSFGRFRSSLKKKNWLAVIETIFQNTFCSVKGRPWLSTGLPRTTLPSTRGHQESTQSTRTTRLQPSTSPPSVVKGWDLPSISHWTKL